MKGLYDSPRVFQSHFEEVDSSTDGASVLRHLPRLAVLTVSKQREAISRLLAFIG
jgi:hypothetical protein